MPKDMVVIGCSCGGKEALYHIMPKLEFKESSVIITPHIDERIIYESFCDKFVGFDNVEIEPGKVYLASFSLALFCKKPKITSKEYGYEFTIKNKIARFSIDDAKIKLDIQEIDKIMIEIAKEYGGNCIGVILSGGGNDGSIGLKAIKNKGGLTAVEIEKHPYDTYCDGMPKNAMETTKIDFEGTASEIAEFLNRNMH